MQVGIRGRVHEINRVRHAVFDGELDRVQVVAQRAAQHLRVARDPRQQLARIVRRRSHVALVERRARIVGHDVDLLLAHHVAAEVLLEVHRPLQRHAQRARLVVGVEELLAGVDLVDVAPAAAIERFEERGEADVPEDRVPVERVVQVAHRPLGRAGGMFLVRQQHRRRDGDPQLGGQRVVEELVVGAPPERVVDDLRAAQRAVFQPRAIERDVVRNAIDDHVVAARLGHPHVADLHELRHKARHAHAVDALDQGGGEGVLHPEQDANFFHKLRGSGIGIGDQGSGPEECSP